MRGIALDGLTQTDSPCGCGLDGGLRKYCDAHNPCFGTATLKDFQVAWCERCGARLRRSAAKWLPTNQWLCVVCKANDLQKRLGPLMDTEDA